MKYVDEFRSSKIVARLARRIRETAGGMRYNIMEVCGTHTMNIFRFGLKELLPKNINLISGPGCPVCVTPNEFIDKAILLARQKGVIVATFGDMIRVPGSASSLEKEKRSGGKVKIVYSSIDALELAKNNPSQEIVFLGIGFETTIPTVAQSVLIARNEGIANYSVLCGHKTMPQALKALACDIEINVDGFLLPGHVSAIIGTKPYEFLANKFNKRCVISGFEPVDIMQSILMIIEQKRPGVDIQYTRIIAKAGNILAGASIKRVFDPADSVWRGLGMIKQSGLKIKKAFRRFDAESKFNPKVRHARQAKGCICGDVLKGKSSPPDCVLFAKACTPDHPIGACMVSSEGTCAAYYRYGTKGIGNG